MIDALIVGAGPAGSSLALRLARAGVAVALLERARFPRTKVCGEYLSPVALRALAALGLLGQVRTQAHELRRVVLSAFGCAPICLSLPPPGALSLARSALDLLLLAAAKTAGARCLDGAFLSAGGDRKLTITYRDRQGKDRDVSASVLVGADGAWSGVAQRLRLASAPRRAGRWAMGGHLRGRAQGDELEMFVGPGGYYARNPIGPDVVNAMLVMPAALPAAQADRVVGTLTAGKYRFDMQRLERRVAVGPLRYQPWRAAAGRVILTGDAAGLLDPFTGQGVALALELSAPAAAAVQALLGGANATKVARAYVREREAIVAPKRSLSAAVEFLLRNAWMRKRALRRLAVEPDIAEGVLAAVAGCEPAAHASRARMLLKLIA